MNNTMLFNTERGAVWYRGENGGNLQSGVKFLAGQWPGASCVVVDKLVFCGF